MKELKLGTLSSLKFENKILLAITDKWCEKFNNENPTFDAVIDKDGRYTLRGPVVQHLHPRQCNPTAEQEDTIHE